MTYKTGKNKVVETIVEEVLKPSDVYTGEVRDKCQKVLVEAVQAGAKIIDFRPYQKGEAVLFTFGLIQIATHSQDSPRFIFDRVPDGKAILQPTAESLGWE